MMTAIRVPSFWLLSAAIFAALNYGLSKLDGILDTPPIRVMTATTQVKDLLPGGQLKIDMAVKRYRLCHTVVGRYIHSNSGEVAYYREVIGGDAPIGDSLYSFTIELPSDIRPGKYHYKGVIASTCGDRRYVEVTPGVHFNVGSRAS